MLKSAKKKNINFCQIKWRLKWVTGLQVAIVSHNNGKGEDFDLNYDRFAVAKQDG